jgi:DNA transformation protein
MARSIVRRSLCASAGKTLRRPVESLPNLGPKSGQWLREAGIATVADLKRLGSLVAYRLVKQRQPNATLNLLWSIAAGLKGNDGRELTDEEKDRLRRQLAAMDGDS